MDTQVTPAAEPPEPALARAVRRLLALPASVLLVCLFLPAVKVCDDPVMPAEFPFVWAPYVGGIALVIMALTGKMGGRRAAVVVLAALWLLTAGLFVTGALANVSPDGALVLSLLWIGGVVWGCIRLGKRRWGWRGAAAFAVAHGGLATLWSMVLLADPTHLYGVWVTLVGALLTALGATVWVAIAPPLARPPTPPTLPRATMR